MLERSSFILWSSLVGVLEVVRSTKDWSFSSMVSSRASRSLVAALIRFSYSLRRSKVTEELRLERD